MIKFIKSFFKKSKLYVLGLPISIDSVQPEFLQFIREDVQTICIMTGGFNLKKLHESLEYKSAFVGFDLLLKHGFDFINIDSFNNQKKVVLMAQNCWFDNQGKRKNADEVGLYVIRLYEELREKYPNARITRIAPGSPYLYDGVSKYLIDTFSNIEVINTKSSAELAYEKLCKKLNTTLPSNIVEPTDPILENDCVNILGCVGFVYKDYVNLNQIKAGIKPNSKLYDIKVGYNESISEIQKENLERYYEYSPGSSPSIIAVINESEEDIV